MLNKLSQLLRDVPDFPKPGIIFKDITPLLSEPVTRRQVVIEITNHYLPIGIEAVAGMEARGFLFGLLIAQELGVPFIPVRKAGKLPYHKITEEYSLEYGNAAIEMHEDAIKPGTRVLIHDDLLATGGTACATAKLIKRLQGEVVGFSFLVKISSLDGEEKIFNQFNVKSHYLVTT